MLQIKGMTGDGCTQEMTYSLKRSTGGKQVKVDWRLGLREVVFDPALTVARGSSLTQFSDVQYSAQLSTTSGSGSSEGSNREK